MKMKIKEAIIVEGKYDKQKILSFADAVVIETTGFDVFKNQQTKEYIKRLAKEQGIVILTDSDRAGMRIRNYINSFVPKELVKNAYIPEISGKEKRKSKPSREGNLGVEGVDSDVIISALTRCGCTVDGVGLEKLGGITRQMLYNDGFIGGENSSEKRAELCKKLGLPSKISTNSLIKALNSVIDECEYRKITETEENKRKSE